MLFSLTFNYCRNKEKMSLFQMPTSVSSFGPVSSTLGRQWHGRNNREQIHSSSLKDNWKLLRMEFHFCPVNIWPDWEQRRRVGVRNDLSDRVHFLTQPLFPPQILLVLIQRHRDLGSFLTFFTSDPCDLGLCPLLTNECLYHRNWWGQSSFVALWNKMAFGGEGLKVKEWVTEFRWSLVGWTAGLTEEVSSCLCINIRTPPATEATSSWGPNWRLRA